MRHQLSVIGATVLSLVIVLGACAPTGPGGSAGGTPKKGGTLILARQGEVTNLDPHKGPAFTSARVFELVYSYLMRLDEDLGVQPDLPDSTPTTSTDAETVPAQILRGVTSPHSGALTIAPTT